MVVYMQSLPHFLLSTLLPPSFLDKQVGQFQFARPQHQSRVGGSAGKLRLAHFGGTPPGMAQHHGRPWQPAIGPGPPSRLATPIKGLSRSPSAALLAISLPEDLVKASVWAALNPATVHRYQTTLSQFFAFQFAHDRAPWLPRDRDAHSPTLVVWLMALSSGSWGRRCSASTLRSRISALSWCHRAFCGCAVTLDPGDALLLQAREAAVPLPRLAKHAATLPLLWEAHSLSDLSQAEDRVTLGATVLAYFFLLRKSEYAWSPDKGQDHHVRVRDLTFFNCMDGLTRRYEDIDLVQLRITSSKPDKRGEGVNLCLKRSGAFCMCPVDATYVLWSNAVLLGLDPGDPLCTFRLRGKNVPLKAAKVTSLIKAATTKLRKDPQNFGSHSLRSGGATAMFRDNISKTAIKLFGRWTSDAFESYIQIADCDVEDMSSRMVGKEVFKSSSSGQPPTQPGGLDLF